MRVTDVMTEASVTDSPADPLRAAARRMREQQTDSLLRLRLTEPGQAADPDAEPVLPARSDDDTDVGWGDERPDADDSDRHYTEDVPPHWEP
ncbi:MAG: hypothetical protein M3O55_09205 [Actinomycetota bacterium]|nr:hypothetical protein [Actinomycetota bacterium]